VIIMERKTIEKIKRINKIDTEKLPIVLLSALDLFWSLDRIIDENVDFCKNKVPEYSDDNRYIQVVRDWLTELGDSISTDYLNQGLGTFFLKELLDYLGFNKDDEIAGDIIDEYCMSPDKNKDINILKKQLIEWAIELEELEKVRV
jgi:hypothetical protein